MRKNVIIVLGVLVFFVSCGHPRMEIHIYDQLPLDYNGDANNSVVALALFGSYLNSSESMYSFLTETIRSLPLGAALYLESGTTAQPENIEEQYRRQYWYKSVFPGRLIDPDIRPNPWIWYALPAECIELLKKRKVIIKGENRETILAVWNDTDNTKLQKSYSREKQREILQAARESIFSFWDDAQMPELPPLGANEGLAIRLISRGKDRGCLAWYKNSGDMKLFAGYCAAKALRDPRYPAVGADEAETLMVELFIFGDWEDMSTPEEFIPGYHSVMLIDGVHTTLLQASLVPQRHYTKETFLETLCDKATLDKNAWKTNKNLRWQRSPGIWHTEPL